MNTNHQKKIDFFVLTFTALLGLAFVGMAVNVPWMIILATPLMVAQLLYLSVSDAPAGAGRTRALMILHGFNVISLAMWIVVLWGLGSGHVLWSLPISTAVIGYFAWPFYMVFGGVMYAVISKMTGVSTALEEQLAAE